jgi:hypothetical protein
MAIISSDYIRKPDPTLTVYTVGEIVEMAQFLVNKVPSGWTVTTSSMGNMWFGPDDDNLTFLRPGDLIGEDSNGNLFKMPQELLTCLFDPA